MYTMKKTYHVGYSSYGIQEKTLLDIHSICVFCIQSSFEFLNGTCQQETLYFARRYFRK